MDGKRTEIVMPFCKSITDQDFEFSKWDLIGFSLKASQYLITWEKTQKNLCN